MLLMLDKL